MYSRTWQRFKPDTPHRRNRNQSSGETNLPATLTFSIHTMSQHPLRQPHNKEQPKLKAKQNTRGKRSFTYPVDLPAGAGFVLLWPRYHYFSKEKVSLSVVQSLIISHTERGKETDVGTGRKCTKHRPPPSPINLHRPLPGHRLRSAKTPPFPVN